MTMNDHVPHDLLVPPQRLGALLARARLDRGFTVAEAAETLGAPWTSIDLLEVETGRRPLLDAQIDELTRLYDIDTSTLVPERSRLVVDLEDATMRAGEHVVDLGGGAVERREVLGRYLALVYAMRDARPGTAVPLRVEDLSTLEHVLSAPRSAVVSELERMMLDEGAFVEPRLARLRHRVLLPTLGIVVAATTAGLLLLVATDAGSTDADDGDATLPDPTTEVEIGEAVVQERLPDGRPGPVVPRD